MTSRLIRNFVSCQRHVVRQIYLQSNKPSYAMRGINPASKNWTNVIQRPLVVADSIKFPTQRSCSTTRPAKIERQLDAEKLISIIIVHYKNMGYVTPDYLKNLIEILEKDEEQRTAILTVEHINFLLYVSGNHLLGQQNETENLELFQRLWTLLKQENRLTRDCYIQKLQVLQHNKLPLQDFQEFLNEVAETDAELAKSSEIYNELLKVACSCGNMQQATDIVAAMREKNFALTEQNFNALIMGYGRNGNIDGCQKTVESMQAAGILLSSETQATLFVAYMENNATDKALELLKKHQGGFSAGQVLKMLRTTTVIDLDGALIALLVRELPVEYTSGPDISLELRQLCNELINNGKLETVKSIITALPKPNFNEKQSIDTYGVTILNEFVRAQIPEAEIASFAQLLVDSGKNSRALHLVTEIAMRRNPPTALSFLERLSKVEALRPHYFWPLMAYNFRRHGESGIITTLKHMQRLNVNCDNETLGIYVLPQMRITLENPKLGVKMLIDAGIKASQLLTPLLRHLLTQQKIIEALQIVELYPTKLDVLEQLSPVLSQLAVHIRATRRYQLFAKLLNELSKRNEQPKTDFIGQLLLEMLSKQERLRNDLRSFNRFVLDMQKLGLHISNAALSNLQSILKDISESTDSKVDPELLQRITSNLNQMKDRTLMLPQNAANGTAGAYTFAKHPRDMSLDELECHLIELESKGLNARGVLRRLLQLCVRDNRLERALEIKEKCDKLQVQVSPGMLASTFDLYIKVGNLEKANEMLAKLKKLYPGFQIDEHKFIDYAALLVHENQFEAGKELLKERAAKERITGGDYVIKNVWNFLTNVAQLAARQEPKLPKERNLTLETFEYLRKLGYCNDHNALLGPIVREYLLRGDIKSAVNQFKELAEKYKHTPLQFELLSLLVRLSNGDAVESENFTIGSEEAQSLLKEVTETVVKVHGSINLNSALVLAFAESGTDNQLRRLLINPEFRVNHDLLKKNCEHLGKEGAVRTLLRLAKGARGLNRSIDEQAIYKMLLNNFVKTNDYIAALQLFQHLEDEDDLKISSDFLKDLVNLLKMNKIEVPSNIALKAQVI